MKIETIWVIIFYLLLADSIGANITAWTGLNKWYKRHFKIVEKYLPITRGWTIYYLILVLIIGYLVHNFVTPIF